MDLSAAAAAKRSTVRDAENAPVADLHIDGDGIGGHDLIP
jgi:hypothetical protein